MRPRRAEGESSNDLFRARLSNQLDGKRPLVRLTALIAWDGFDAEFGPLYHETLGRPGKPTRWMVGLTYLKHSYSLSDELAASHPRRRRPTQACAATARECHSWTHRKSPEIAAPNRASGISRYRSFRSD
jgi:hypothetical protein